MNIEKKEIRAHNHKSICGKLSLPNMTRIGLCGTILQERLNSRQHQNEF